jgi:hypothetical protein
MSREIAMQNQLFEMNERLERLERANRRLKRTAGLLAGGVALTGLAAFAAPAVCDVVYAERLVLRDTSGKQRLVMDAYKSEAPTITWHEKDGRALAKLCINTDGVASIDYFDKQGGSTKSYRFSPDGKAQTKTDAAPTVAQTQ